MVVEDEEKDPVIAGPHPVPWGGVRKGGTTPHPFCVPFRANPPGMGGGVAGEPPSLRLGIPGLTHF